MIIKNKYHIKTWFSPALFLEKNCVFDNGAIDLHEHTYHKIVKNNLPSVVHRKYGPAITYEDGELVWFSNGSYYRNNGPTIKRHNNNVSWTFNGVFIQEEEYWNK